MLTRFSRKYQRWTGRVCGLVISMMAVLTFFQILAQKNRDDELNPSLDMKQYFKLAFSKDADQLDEDDIKLLASEVGKPVTNEKMQFDSNKVKHIAFLKVHKTGSSSVQHLFLRYGDARDLTFVLASKEHNECDDYFNCISFYNTLHESNILPPPKDKSYDIMCSHVIYDKKAFGKYLPPDTKFIGIVREPVRRLESAFGFFDLFPNVTLSQYIRNVEHYNHPMTNNRMAFEFGFKTKWFPNATHVTLSDTQTVEVNEYVGMLMNDFDLILVNERLDESLVLMRRLLGWTIQDMIYQRTLVRPHDNFRPEDREQANTYLYLDYILYNRAVKTLNTKITEASSDFHDEVNTFKMFITKVAAFCGCKDCGPDAEMTMPSTHWSGSFQVNRAFCDVLSIPEEHYLNILRDKQTGNHVSEELKRKYWINRRIKEFWVN